MAARTLIRDRRGFALIFLVSLIPVFLALLTALFAVHQVDHRVRQGKTDCVKSLWLAQRNTAVELNQLWALNPLARALRFQARSAEIQLAAAVASGNPATVAAVEARILRIQSQRRALAAKQNELLLRARGHLERGLREARTSIATARDEFGTVKVSLPDPARLGVRPDTPDLAPVYETVPAFETVQALEQRWQSEWSITGRWSRFLEGRGKGKHACIVSLTHTNERFEPTLSAGKFSSRAL